MDAQSFINDVLAEKGHIGQVYWVACGGSVIDLYPAHLLIQTEGTSVASSCYTAREFCLMLPKRLREDCLVVVCSHSGGTPETIDAAWEAKKHGASVLALTDNAGSAIDNGEWPCWVYPWGEEIPQAEVPAGISLLLAGDLLAKEDGYEHLDALVDGIAKMDEILPKARTRICEELGDKFAQACRKHPFFYILGSGPNFSQTYGMAICSLMEMQRQHCCYIHSGEYFHGPFECTEPGVLYFLQMGSGVCRKMDQRALDFLKQYTDEYLVLDALDYGMDAVDEAVRDYLDPILFYAANVQLRNCRGKEFDHDPDLRRYMGVVDY